MKTIRFLPLIMVMSFATSTSAASRVNDQLSPEAVPANVRNSFNRIFVNNDPEAWFMEMVKVKGQKKEKRFIAMFNDPEGVYRVRFDETGRAVGYIMSYPEGDPAPAEIVNNLQGMYPAHTYHSFEKVYLYQEEQIFYKVNMNKKSRQEQIFVTLEGELLAGDHSLVEFIR